MKRAVPVRPAYRYTYYDKLRGVDFSKDMTEVHRRRSPDMLNLISDNGGNPVKRLGWRKVNSLGCGKIHNLFIHTEEIAGVDEQVKYVTSETGVYSCRTLADGTDEVNHLIALNLVQSAGFFVNNNNNHGTDLYTIYNGNIYKLTYSTAENLVLTGNVKIPEVSISRNPDGTGGVSLEAVNLLSSKWTFSFLGNEEATEYSLYPEKIADYNYIVADTIKVEVMNADGVFEELEKTTDWTHGTAEQKTGMDLDGTFKEFNVCKPKITFTVSHAPIVTGQDNVRITFEPFDTSSMQGHCKGLYREGRSDLLSTRATRAYGYGTTDRTFAVGGRTGNKVYYSDVADPTFFPDNNYIVVGQDNNHIVGMHRYQSALVLLKGDKSKEPAMYFVNGQNFEGNTVFSVKSNESGEGAASAKTLALLGDEPLFLTKNGVLAITNIYATSESTIRNRSYFVDKRLTREPNLETAASAVWQRYYILCVNGHAYVLDGRNKSSETNNTTNYSYECYYWENIPATCFDVFHNELYFGTADGYICKFNSDVKNRTAYCDDGTLVSGVETLSLDGGVAIPCRWSTMLDDDGMPQYFKTLNKKGTLLTILPYERTSAEVTLITDGEREIKAATFYADIQTWDVVDFERFTFSVNETAQDDFFRKKAKKYKRLQIVVENNAIYEPFGILKITKTFTVNNFSKNRG